MNLRFEGYYILRFLSRMFFGRGFLLRNKLARKIYLFLRECIIIFSYVHWRQKFWEKQNPDSPWLVKDSIVFIESWLNEEMKGFEFGSGRSTKWFTERVSFYYSIEGDFDWYKKTIEMNKDNIKNEKCEIVFKDAGDQIKIDRKKVKLYSSSLSKFRDKYFDFGLIDGHFRIECIYNSINKIKPNGILIIDNSDAIDGINEFLSKYKYKKFSNGIWETSILYIQ